MVVVGVLLPCLVIMHAAALIGTVAAAGGQPPAMYVFGSSILDVGNNNYLPGAAVGRANSPYNGVDFPGSVPTGRFSNGYNIADYVAKNMGFACSPPPYLSLLAQSSSGPLLVQTALTSGINYASGGAGILDATNAGNTIPLSKEVKYFGATKAKMVAAVGPNTVDPVISRSIFLIGMGNNDLYVFAASERARNRSDADERRDAAAALYASLISNYSATMTELYSLGARRFAVINVWLLGCVPGERVLSPTGACSDVLNEVVAGFNKALGSLLADLAGKLPGLVYSLGDSFGFTEDVLANPARATPCCASTVTGMSSGTVCIRPSGPRFSWPERSMTDRPSTPLLSTSCNSPSQASDIILRIRTTLIEYFSFFHTTCIALSLSFAEKQTLLKISSIITSKRLDKLRKKEEEKNSLRPVLIALLSL